MSIIIFKTFNPYKGTIITPIGQALISAYDSNATDEKGCPITTGTMNANILLSSCLLVSVVLQFLIKEDLKRQNAEKQSISQEIEETESKEDL